jgi:hypothetical protein
MDIVSVRVDLLAYKILQIAKPIKTVDFVEFATLAMRKLMMENTVFQE